MYGAAPIATTNKPRCFVYTQLAFWGIIRGIVREVCSRANFGGIF